MSLRHRARLALRLAWRDLRAQPGRTALVLALVTISAALISTAGVATARALAPGSTVGLSGADHIARSSTLDPHVVTFLFVAAGLGALLTVLLVVPVFLTGLRRRTRELALLAVAGARTSDLVTAVLLPAGLCGLLGSASGAAVGLLIGTAITSAPGDPSTAQVQWAVMAAVAAGAVVLALSLGSAVYPALLVARSPLVDVLAGRLMGGPRLPHIPRAIMGLGLVGTGGWAAYRGAVEASAPWAVGGIVLAAGGGILLTSVVLGLVGQVRLRWSYAAAFALRDAARHQIRILPGAAASAGGVAAVVAAMMYTGSMHAAEAASYQTSAPIGAAYVQFAPDGPGPGDEEIAALFAGVAEVTTVARIEVVADQHEPLMAQDANGLWEPIGVGGSTLTMSGPLIGTQELVEVFNLDQQVTTAMAQGTLALSPNSSHLLRDDGAIRLYDGEGAVAVPAMVVLPEGAPTDALVPQAVAEQFGHQVRQVGVVVVTDRPLTNNDGELLQAALPSELVMVETGPPDLGTRETEYALLAAATAVIVILAWLMAALAAQESRADQATLQAVGAAPSFRSRVIGLQGGLTALFAVIGGIPSGLVLGWLLLQIQRNQPMYTPGDAIVTVPWLPVVVLAVGLPPLVALGTTLLAPRDPVLTRRDAD